MFCQRDPAASSLLATTGCSGAKLKMSILCPRRAASSTSETSQSSIEPSFRGASWMMMAIRTGRDDLCRNGVARRRPGE